MWKDKPKITKGFKDLYNISPSMEIMAVTGFVVLVSDSTIWRFDSGLESKAATLLQLLKPPVKLGLALERWPTGCGRAKVLLMFGRWWTDGRNCFYKR